MTESVQDPAPATVARGQRALEREQRRIEKTEREARALLLRRSGLDYRNIAKILDCSPSGAHLMVTRHLARLPVESATELRRHLMARLEEVHRVNGPHVDEPARANVVLRTIEATAKLTGLNQDSTGGGSFANAQLIVQNTVTGSFAAGNRGEDIDPTRPKIIIRSDMISPPTALPDETWAEYAARCVAVGREPPAEATWHLGPRDTRP